MRVLIVSDVHANLVALEAVLRDAERGGPVDALWSLGDCVGYGPQPAECIARLKGFEAVMVAGNHERAATGAISTEDFNPDAAAAAQWTKARLSPEERAFLDTLPEVISPPPPDEGDGRSGNLLGPGAGRGEVATGASASNAFTLVHGTLRWPIWEYLYSREAALGHLALQQTPFGLVGHTHVPMLVIEEHQSEDGCRLLRLDDGDTVDLDPRQRIVLNPGSVGQPRDGDPRASYTVYDTDSNSITLRRVEYAIEETQKLMAEARLPRWLIDRLAVGR